jgi:hypothetical protein
MTALAFHGKMRRPRIAGAPTASELLSSTRPASVPKAVGVGRPPGEQEGGRRAGRGGAGRGLQNGALAGVPIDLRLPDARCCSAHGSVSKPANTRSAGWGWNCTGRATPTTTRVEPSRTALLARTKHPGKPAVAMPPSPKLRSGCPLEVNRSTAIQELAYPVPASPRGEPDTACFSGTRVRTPPDC